MPAISALIQKVKARESQVQGQSLPCSGFEGSLGYMKICLQIKKINKIRKIKEERKNRIGVPQRAGPMPLACDTIPVCRQGFYFIQRRKLMSVILSPQSTQLCSTACRRAGLAGVNQARAHLCFLTPAQDGAFRT